MKNYIIILFLIVQFTLLGQNKTTRIIVTDKDSTIEKAQRTFFGKDKTIILVYIKYVDNQKFGNLGKSTINYYRHRQNLEHLNDRPYKSKLTGYYSNGIKGYEGQEKYLQKNGKWLYWGIDGKLDSTCTYIKGDLIKTIREK